MADYGTLSAIANAGDKFLESFRTERDYQLKKRESEEQKALQKKMFQAQLAEKGMEEGSGGILHKTAEQKQRESYDKAVKQAGLLKEGYEAKLDPISGEYQASKVSGFHSVEDDYKRAQIREINAKIADLGRKSVSNKATFDGLPHENQEQISGLAKKSAERTNIINAMQSGLERLEDPALNKEQKLAHARSMIKLLNSQVGNDAVAAEEAKRLAGYLEYHVLPNLTEPGPVFGRADMGEFAGQVRQSITALSRANELNTNETDRLYGRAPKQRPNELKFVRDEGLINRGPGAGLLGQDAMATDVPQYSPQQLNGMTDDQLYQIFSKVKKGP